jgi:predicted esterase
MRRLLLLLLGSIFFNSYAQTITPVPPTSNHLGYLEYLPPNYSSTTEKYPCIIFLHGSGEIGNGLEPDIWKVALLGPLREVKVNKHTMCFTVNGKQECFIVIAPQAPYVGAFSGTDFQNLYNHILNSYRIDPERIYVTGLSYGGQTSFTWAASDQNSPNKIAALGIMSGMTDCTTAQNVGAKNIPIWWHHGDKDSTPWTSYAKALTILDCINSVDPNPPPIFTVYPGLGHSATLWNQAYSPSHTYNNPNLYEWFLSYTLNKKENIPPSVNAGLDKNIQLPTNTVVLSGTASDQDGSITIYHWIQQSGPTATLQGIYTPNLTVTNLLQGTYVFRLWAKDDDGAAAYDDVTVFATDENVSGTNNLIGHWTLNKNATDYSGNNYHGTIINGAGYSTDCNEGSYALELNGINQYVDLDSPDKLPSGTSPRSLSLWAKTNNISYGYRFAASFGKPSNSNAMFIGQYGPDLNGGGFSNDVVVKNFWKVGIWHHIVLTYDGTTAKMYADGIEVASQSKNWDLIAEKAFIGMQVNGKEFWNGEIDDVRIYNKSLTTPEIQGIYESSNFIGHWTLDQNTNDCSGNNYHGTIINGAGYSTDCNEGSYALKLNGINQYVDLDSPDKLPSGTSPRSLSLWAKTNNISYGYRFAASFGKPSNSNAMFIGQYGPDLNGGGYANDVVVKNFWKVGIWRHIVLTYDGTTAKMYADGIEVASQSKKWNLIAEKAFIGMQVNGKEFWNGEIDDVRIYNKALNIGEIQELAISQSNAQARESETIENSLTNNILESPKIYPNPVSDNLFIEIPLDLLNNNQALNFKLIDLMGNIVKDYTIDHSGLMSIDVTELKNATYLYFISSNDQVLFRNKLLKLSD